MTFDLDSAIAGSVATGMAFFALLHLPRWRKPASPSDPLAGLKEDAMALSARAQSIVDRVNALSANLTQKIADDEAAHDAANAAAVDADDTAVEAALTTLEQSVAAPPTPPVA